VEVSSQQPRSRQVPVGLLLWGLLMLTLMVGVVAGLHGYLGMRLVSEPGLPGPWAGLGWGVLGLGFASIPAAMASTRMRPSWKEQVLHWGGMLWLGAFGLLLTATGVADVVGWGWRLVGSAPEPLALARGKALAVVGVVPEIAELTLVSA
jgi:hypothetical protein